MSASQDASMGISKLDATFGETEAVLTCQNAAVCHAVFACKTRAKVSHLTASWWKGISPAALVARINFIAAASQMVRRNSSDDE